MARALAIVGMFAVHVGPTGEQDLAGRVYAMPHGRAALLFLVVAGVGTVMLATSAQATWRRTTTTVLWRAALLLLVGLALQELDHGVSVILQSYAVLFVVALPLLWVPTRWAWGFALAALPTGGVVYLWTQLRENGELIRDPVALSDPAGEVAQGLLLSGPYPLVTWLAPFVLGMCIGRLDLTSPKVQRWLVGVGVAVTVASLVLSRVLERLVGVVGEPERWQLLVVDTPHSQMPLWLTGSTATAVAILGAALWGADRFPRTVAPLLAMGRLALTWYVGHLLLLHAFGDQVASEQPGRASLVVLSFAAVSLAASMLWLAIFRQGPLERLLRPPPIIAGRAATASSPDPSRPAN